MTATDVELASPTGSCCQKKTLKRTLVWTGSVVVLCGLTGIIIAVAAFGGVSAAMVGSFGGATFVGLVLTVGSCSVEAEPKQKHENGASQQRKGGRNRASCDRKDRHEGSSLGAVVAFDQRTPDAWPSHYLPQPIPAAIAAVPGSVFGGAVHGNSFLPDADTEFSVAHLAPSYAEFEPCSVPVANGCDRTVSSMPFLGHGPKIEPDPPSYREALLLIISLPREKANPTDPLTAM